MRTIYYKSAPENPSSLKELLKDYFEKYSPKTFWSDDNSPQCGERRDRSVDDLLLLSNHYFPETTIFQMMSAYNKIDKDYNKDNKKIIFAICSTIERIRLCNGTFPDDGGYDTTNLMFTANLKGVARNSQWTMEELSKLDFSQVEEV